MLQNPYIDNVNSTAFKLISILHLIAFKHFDATLPKQMSVYSYTARYGDILQQPQDI